MSYEQTGLAEKTSSTKFVLVVIALSLLFFAAVFVVAKLTIGSGSSETVKKRVKSSKSLSRPGSLKVRNNPGGLQNNAPSSQGGISPAQNNYPTQ